ncbi:MAG: phosphonate metabolism protein/1,5-bisphosphokinase (PRPP-forming) PhnN [Pseudomonadota bacterium]
MTGRLIGVVGPSGVGKDSVMAGLAAEPRFTIARRVITRAPELGGEDYDPVSEAVFEQMIARDAFCLHWRAHGLSYGIPVAVAVQVEAGGEVLVNLSRSVLRIAQKRFARFVVLNITAAPETLAARLAARGRESDAEIGRRLSRATYPLPDGVPILSIANDGALNETVAAARARLALEPLEEKR